MTHRTERFSTMIQVTQRYANKVKTISMPRYYNVFIDGTYSGYAYPNTLNLPEIQGDWVWCVPQVEMFDRASRDTVTAAVAAWDASHAR